MSHSSSLRLLIHGTRKPKVVVAVLIASATALSAFFVTSKSSAQEMEPPRAQIDVGSSTPVVTSKTRSFLPIDFSISCAMPDLDDECDISTTLHFRSGSSDWSSLSKLLNGLGVEFLVPVPTAARVDYYLEVRERTTGAQLTFPEGGAQTPLSFHVVSFNDPIRLPSIPFGSMGADFETVVRMPWGTAPDEAGLIPGNEGSTIGPQSADITSDGSIYVLDQVNDRVQVFDRAGILVNSIPFDLGPLGDIAVREDGAVRILDVVPDGPGSHPVVHLMDRLDAPFSPPLAVETRTTAEWEPALLRIEDGVTWVYGTPSDSWRPLPDGSDPPELQMGMPSSTGEVLRRVKRMRRVDVLPAASGSPGGVSLLAPTDRFFGELAMVEPDADGGYWIVVRTWREEPSADDQHELVHVTPDGQVLEHVALQNSEYAEFAPLSQFRLGDDGDLYQLWSDEVGFEVRRFDL